MKEVSYTGSIYNRRIQVFCTIFFVVVNAQCYESDIRGQVDRTIATGPFAAYLLRVGIRTFNFNVIIIIALCLRSDINN